MNQSHNSCQKCQRPFKGKRFRCSRCRSAWYCGPECQKENWSEHKMRCKVERFIQNTASMLLKENRCNQGRLPLIEIAKFFENHQAQRQNIMNTLMLHISEDVPLNEIMDFINYPRIRNMNECLDAEWKEVQREFLALAWKDAEFNKVPEPNVRGLATGTKTKWIDINRAFSKQCKGYIASSDIEKAMECEYCTINILATNSTHKWLVFQENTYVESCKVRIDQQTYKLFVIECGVDMKKQSKIVINISDHGVFLMRKLWDHHIYRQDRDSECGCKLVRAILDEKYDIDTDYRRALFKEWSIKKFGWCHY